MARPQSDCERKGLRADEQVEGVAIDLAIVEELALVGAPEARHPQHALRVVG